MPSLQFKFTDLKHKLEIFEQIEQGQVNFIGEVFDQITYEQKTLFYIVPIKLAP